MCTPSSSAVHKPVSRPLVSTPSMRYLRIQPIRKPLAARRATAGLALANSKEHNNAEGLPHERGPAQERSECFGCSVCFGHGGFLTGPKAASQIGQCASSKAPTFGAVLEKGMPEPAPRAGPSPRAKRVLWLQRVQWVFSADCVGMPPHLPWPIWDALSPKISHRRST